MARQPKEAGQVLTRQRAKGKEPGLWKVLLHNDDYTTQEFVVWLLKTVFRKAEPEATAIMLAVHKAGVGVAGIYTKDVAETRAERARQLAEREGFPLLLTVEAEDA
ncbi:ATP-dependent Clp protease adaptor ClpS [Geothrix alkalitolerans]|uniref:ATP-dependent Clp protease adaptor ClpS n=1 Tax=Geothrix alkalitolerans TaxID=2922724 RepID=UPI001FAEF025|nr:ATP-dependent Clp protease adaptor ClpS [Geothrix alkalitolerans]